MATIIDSQQCSSLKYCFKKTFEGVEDWMIPFIKIIPVFSAGEAHKFNKEGLIISHSIDYCWIKINEVTYELHYCVYLTATIYDEYVVKEEYPIKVDVNCYFYNPKYYFQLKSKDV
jgi:hypothetical protein